MTLNQLQPVRSVHPRAGFITSTSIILFTCLFFCPAWGQMQDSTHINNTHLALVSGVTLGTIVGGHIYQANAWWGKTDSGPFRVANDWTYALNIDKLGHLYASYFLSQLFIEGMQWSGFDRRSSVFYGAITGLLYELYVETEDGFHKSYGFSPGDAFADLTGAMIPLVQETYPVLKNYSLKYSYYPSERLKTKVARTFIDDYEGMSVWIGMDPHYLFGENVNRVVPSWLGIAFGAGIRDMEDPNGMKRVFMFSLDYNFSKIKTDIPFLATLLHWLDFIHWPAPGIKIENNKIRVGVFYP